MIENTINQKNDSAMQMQWGDIGELFKADQSTV